MHRRPAPFSEPARHPFRQSLPPPSAEPVPDDDHDVKLFLLSFAAFFVCFYTFIV
jgi:hypothetical protein